MTEENGLVCAFVLDGKGRGQPLDWDGMKKWRMEDGTLWAHLDCSVESAGDWLLNQSGLDETICEALLEDGTRPRLVFSKQGMLVILRGVNGNPGEDPEDMVALRMWFEKNRVITMRQRKIMVVDDIRSAVRSGDGPVSINNFLVRIVEGIVERMRDVIDDIDDQVDELEDEVVTAESSDLRPKLARLRQQSISLRRYISPQRDILFRLHQDRNSRFEADERDRLREAAERTARFIEDIDHARDRAVIIGEELNSRVAEQMSKTMYRLSIIAAIFLPLGLVTGLLGINVGGIPGSENKAAFLIVSGLLIAIALGLYALFRRLKWL